MSRTLRALALGAAAAWLAALPARAVLTTLASPQGQTFSGFTESVCTGALEFSEGGPFEFGSTNPVAVLFENVSTEQNILDCDPTQTYSCVSRTVQDRVELHFGSDFTGASGFLNHAVFGTAVGGSGDPEFAPGAAALQLAIDNGAVLPTVVSLVPIGPTGSFDFAYEATIDPPLLVDGPTTFDVVVAGNVAPTLQFDTTASTCPGGGPPVLTGSGSTQLVLQDYSLALDCADVPSGVPIAQITLGEEPHSCGQPLLLDGSGSSHTDPERSLVAYEWDLDEDGLFDDATGPITTSIFDAFGTRVVALRVTDDGTPPQQDVMGVVVTAENRAPVADAGGPYDIGPDDTLFLDGSGSSDPNELCGDVVIGHDWDLNGDDTDDAMGPSPDVTPEQRMALDFDLGTMTLRLRTTDIFGEQDEDVAIVRVGTPPDAPNLRLEKDASTLFVAGQRAVYNLEIRNIGGEPAPGPIVVTDTLPPGLTFIGTSSSEFTCPDPPAGPEIECTHPGPLQPGQSLFLFLDVEIAEDVAAEITNTASVSSPGDADPDNNGDSVTLPVTLLPDLAIEKRALEPFVSGTNAAYLITVTNVGRGPYADKATIRDELPPGILLIEPPPPPFVCDVTSFIVLCTVDFTDAPLAPGESVVMRLDVAVTGEPRQVFNRARLTATDPNPSNNGPADVFTDVLEEPFEEPPECDLEIEGWIAPAQGVWQDDDHFEDKATKQLTRLAPTIYEAELDMVKDRQTLLFGIRDRPPEGETPGEARRNRIVIRGRSGGVDTAVRMRFVLEQGSDRRVLYVGPLDEAPLDGPCGTPREFKVEVDATNGIPPARSFVFRQTGAYRIVAELVRDGGAGTGVRVAVVGEVVDPPPLQVQLVPGSFLGLPPEGGMQLQRAATGLAELSKRRLPDYMPIGPNGIVVNPEAFRDFAPVVERAQGRGPFGGVDADDAIREELTVQLQTGAFLAGTDRIAVLLPVADYETVDPILDRGGSAGFAPSTKVTFIRDGYGSLFTVDTIAHEVIHTLPYLWSGPSEFDVPVIDPDDPPSTMRIDCGDDWHNRNNPVGYGHRITFTGVHNRKRFEAGNTIMGLGPGEDWIAQCTYWHVLEELKKNPDPELLLVQGLILRDDGEPLGELLPFYETLGSVFREDSDEGDWAVLLRDAAGARLGRFPIRPEFEIPDANRGERDLVAFSFQVPRIAGTARVELVGPPVGAVLDTTVVSASAPEVELLAPAEGALLAPGDGTVDVAWTASDADGDAPLLATVLYSPDGGATWRVVSFEQEGEQATVPVAARPTGHRVRVVVTDGARSSEDEVSFALDVAPEADLSVTKTVDPGVALPGGKLHYTLEVRNEGPTDASGVVLTDPLPAGALFDAATAGCEEAAGVVTCDLGDLPVGGVVVREIVVQVAPDAAEPLENRATVAGDEPDPEDGNDESVVATPLPEFGDCPDEGVHPKAHVSRFAFVAESARVCEKAHVLVGSRVEDDAVVGERAVVGVAAHVAPGAALAREAALGVGARLGERSLVDVGARVGVGSIVGSDGVVGRDARIGVASALGDAVRVGAGAHLGNEVTAESEVRIGAGAWVGQGVALGERVAIGAGARVEAHCELARDVQVGEGARLRRGAKVGAVAIVGPGAFVGRNAEIGEAAVIGRDAVVASGAVVPPGAFVPDGAVFP